MKRLVQLPMYDWIETRIATDALWSSIRSALQRQGKASPETLDRDQIPEAAWLSPQLLLSQTCGLPLVQNLRGRVSVLGRFCFQGQSPSGDYHSVIIVRDTAAAENFESLLGQRAAINHESSYSGCLALKRWVSLVAAGDGGFSRVITTGSHRESVRAIAAGLADIAAIDCVSWSLARRFDSIAKSLKVVARTDDRPGLPLITAIGSSPRMIDTLRIALDEAIRTLDPTNRDTLGIKGFVAADDIEYDIINDDLQQFSTAVLTSGNLANVG